ncbi:hypothetical protein [Patiriisocius hiemis]|uniref:Lipoprotein n=1 Tax=Patiriisocius hiemis TaxID=3075604 RepID=A0ABU2YB80_9FLAO|nr:hypothetical protein [Constantimarinum sp. W242]MDT0555267.1 hypothetical protein [Constantimarinum sp. W242]
MYLKSTLLFTIFLLIFCSCSVKSYREKNKHYFDISNELNFIESNIKNSNDNNFKIEIFFGHRNLILATSDIKVYKDSVNIKTNTKDFYEKKHIYADTSFVVSKEKFLREILYQKNNASKMIILAGNYQSFRISKGEKVIEYPTTRIAGYMIDFLEKGKVNYK